LFLFKIIPDLWPFGENLFSEMKGKLVSRSEQRRLETPDGRHFSARERHTSLLQHQEGHRPCLDHSRGTHPGHGRGTAKALAAFPTYTRAGQYQRSPSRW